MDSFNREYWKLYLNIWKQIITKNKFVIKNSMGDLTNPHAKVEEKLAGSISGPLKNIDGKSTMNINTLNAAR